MAEDDIYGSKSRYEKFKERIRLELLPPSQRQLQKGFVGKYRCQIPANLRHFQSLFANVEARDLSYIRRNRLLQSMRLICHLSEKDLAHCTRDDINTIITSMHGIYHAAISKETFIRDIKFIFKSLFPEKDAQGRPDETLVPYVVRHLSAKCDKSREKMRQDRFTWEEFERVVNYFSNDARIQAYLTLALESLARPQELLYLRLRDVELHDNYAKIYIHEHGKEGLGLLQCIDSYPYLLKWLNVHPFKKQTDAFLFINTGNTNRCKQLRPQNLNKWIRKACKDLHICKPITCYSLKRNGVTIRRLRGESDMEIQHAARWTSTKQLKTYDLSCQEDAFKRELEKRGIIPSTSNTIAKTQICAYCEKVAGFSDVICQQCKRPLDRNVLREEQREKEKETQQLREELSALKRQIEKITQVVTRGLMLDILQSQDKEKFDCLNTNHRRPSPARLSPGLFLNK